VIFDERFEERGHLLANDRIAGEDVSGARALRYRTV